MAPSSSRQRARSSGSTFTAHAGGADGRGWRSGFGVTTAAAGRDRCDNQAPGGLYERHKIGTSKVHRMETDVVCGMRVDPAKAAGSDRARREDLLLLRKGLPAALPGGSEEVSRSRLSSRHACDARGARSADARQRRGPSATGASSRPRTVAAAPSPPDAREYTCPMHPEVRQRGPGSCPICGMALEPVEVIARGAAERRARRHEPPLLVVARADRADSRLHGGRVPARAAAASCAMPPRVADLDRARARDAGRAVGRVAVLRARLGVGRQPVT